MSEDTTHTLQSAGALPSVAPPRPGVLALFSQGRVPTSGVYEGQADTTVGRSPDQQIFVDDPGLSRSHASLLFDDGRIRVRDHASHNGTFVNGQRVQGEAPVGIGDVVRCGTTLLAPIRDTAAFSRWPQDAEAGPLLGGPAMGTIRRMVEITAAQPIDVLVTGESGTGKEVVARLLHDASGRRGAFVPVNCAAMPDTLFEGELFGAMKGAFTGAVADRPGLMQAAAEGTLFLDEVGELPPPLQAKLLRAVELREVRPLGASRPIRVDLRLVAATNRNLEHEVEHGTFRQDLFHRICGVTIAIPPLRQRLEDVVIFARRCLQRAQSGGASPGVRSGAREPEIPADMDGSGFTMTALFVERLLLYGWPGNVREIERTLHEAMIQARLGGQICLLPSHLRPVVLGDGTDTQMLAKLRDALHQTGGNVAQAAGELGIARSQIYSLLREHGLHPKDFR